MSERRTLVEGLKQTPQLDRKTEQEFVFQNRPAAVEPPRPAPTTPAVSAARNRSPISTRIRTDLAEALKRASLQRQLEKVEPNAINDILEEALEPWLRGHGYLETGGV